MPRSLFILALLLSGAVGAQTPPEGWPAPGDGFDWHTVGDRPVKAKHLAFDLDGALWTASAASGGNNTRLDDPDAPDAFWIESGSNRIPSRVLALGRDTVLVGEGVVWRTTDGGETWGDYIPTPCSGQDGGPMLAVPFDTPPGPWGATAGLLLAGNRGLCRSDDRGATWTEVPQSEPSQYELIVHEALVLPPGHAHAGRLVVATREGVWLSDEGETTLMLRRRTGATVDYAEHLAVLPSGRLLATGFDLSLPHRRAYVSDDGGESWRETAALPEPQDGIGGDAWLAVIGDRTAVAVGGRGIVRRTDDDGETWAIVGRVPITEDILTSRHVLVDPQGRLYVAVMRAGSVATDAWVWRTTAPLVVAEESAPVGETLGVTVRPNPSASGAVTVEVSVAAPVEVRAVVLDALGRTVAEVLAGPVSGTRVVEVDTAGWAAGVYSVVVEGGGGRVIEAFTVVR